MPPKEPTYGRRRGQKPKNNSLYDDAKTLSDMAWEDAMRMADALAPAAPSDAEELSEWDQFQILMAAAAEFSPGYWDDPDALEDLWRLKKQYTGIDDRQLKDFASKRRQLRRGLPDPRITPQNPEWEKLNNA